PGEYDLYPYLQSRSSGNRAVYTARVPIDVTGGDIKNIKISVQPGKDISGRIKLEGIDTARSRISLEHIKVQLVVQSPRFGNTNLVSLNARGEFAFHNVLDGTYSVRLGNLPPDAYISSIRGSTSSSYEKSSFTINGDDPPSLEIGVTSPGGTLEGVVQKRDSLEWADIIVTLIPDGAERQNSWLYKTARLDSSGHFRISGIAPATYSVFAWKSLAPYQDPDFLREVEPLGKRVDLHIGENATVQINLTQLD
ncbi:MAG TPA: hypothetical protein VFO86_02410, partial [Terriglobia bacterium]|nr:hypothetical protein [Terriglobia bacterium]